MAAVEINDRYINIISMSSSICQENENNGFISEIHIKFKHNINTHRKYDLTAASNKLKLLVKIYNYCSPTCLQPLCKDDKSANNG
jgi:hypothetical protein